MVGLGGGTHLTVPVATIRELVAAPIDFPPKPEEIRIAR